MKNICIVGVGLIGGSLSLEIKKLHPEVCIIGIDKNEENLQQAIDLQIINKKGSEEDFKTADLVLVCIPVDKIYKELPSILDKIGEKTLVIDMGSTKQKICQSVENHPKRNQFLAAHPIAGTENSGAKSAFLGLFSKKVMIICEIEKTLFKLQEIALKLFQDMQMRIRYMSAEMHDKHIAYVSHLSHISSFMLGKTVIEKEESEKDIFDMAGSGFESTVRLAKSSASMWVPIFEQNKNYVIDSLSEYISNLEKFKILLENNEFEKVFEQIKDINKLRDILNGIVTNKK